MTRQRTRAFVGVVLAALFWAANAVIARWLADDVGPFALAFWRWSFALVLLLPFGLPRLRGTLDVLCGQGVRLFWLGLLSVGAYNTLLYIAAHTTTALNITLVNSTMPIAIAVLAHFVLGQRTTAPQALGFTLAAVGMLVIVSRGTLAVFAEFAFRPGDLLMIVAVIVWAVYSVLLRRWRIDLHPLAFLTATMALGVAVLLPFFLWEVAARGHFTWTSIHLATFGYLAIFASILSFLFWNNAVLVLGPNTTGIFIYLVPVFTAGLAYATLGEALNMYHAAGGAMILAGLLLATRGGRSEPAITAPAVGVSTSDIAASR